MSAYADPFLVSKSFAADASNLCLWTNGRRDAGAAPVFMVLLRCVLGCRVPNTAYKKDFPTQFFLRTAVIAIGVGLLVCWAVKRPGG